MKNTPIDFKISPKIKEMQRVVAEETNSSIDFCINKSRERSLSDARHLFSYVLMDMYPKMSFAVIGDITGGRTHASVINSKTRVKNLLDTDDFIRSTYNAIIDKCTKIKNEDKRIYKVDIAMNIINQFLNTGEYDIMIDNGFGICIDKYLWCDDDTIGKVIEKLLDDKIPIHYHLDKKTNSKYIIVSEDYFV